MICRSDDIQIPVFVTRAQLSELLGLSVEEIKRLDYEGILKRSVVSGKPVKYHGWSVRDLMKKTAN